MALGILNIIYMFLLVTAIIIQILLYKNKDETKNSIFSINMLFGIVLSYLAYTSFPTNFMGLRISAIGLGVISVLAMGLKLNNKRNIVLSKIMLSASIALSFLLLYL